MTDTFKASILAALLIPAAAFANLTPGQTLGTTEAEIRSALTALGYEVQEVEFEDGEIEAEVTQGGQALEIEIAVETGQIIEVELEDEEDDD